MGYLVAHRPHANGSIVFILLALSFCFAPLLEDATDTPIEKTPVPLKFNSYVLMVLLLSLPCNPICIILCLLTEVDS